jgi:hypothetical protein
MKAVKVSAVELIKFSPKDELKFLPKVIQQKHLTRPLSLIFFFKFMRKTVFKVEEVQKKI